MPSPISFKDLFGVEHVEPSVTGLIELQTQEVVRPTPVNDLILLSPFRSGRPGVLQRFRQMSSLASYHDPDGTGDQGVALARSTRSPFGDDGVFGSADILTLRMDQAKQSVLLVKDGASTLFAVKTGDYGFQTQRSRGRLFNNGDGTQTVVLRDDKRTFKSPHLGNLFEVQYVGGVGSASMTIVLDTGNIHYTGQPIDSDSILVNGKGFEFDDDDNVTVGSIKVTIGGSVAETFGNLVSAVNANVPGIVASLDVAASIVTFTGTEVGVVLAEFSGSIDAPVYEGKAARLFTTVGADRDVDLALATGSFKTIDSVVVHFNSLDTYTAKVLNNVNKFIPSNEIDFGTFADILGAPVPVTGFAAALVDWINHKTKGQYLVDIASNDGFYDPDSQTGVMFGVKPNGYGKLQGFAGTPVDVDTASPFEQFAGGLSPSVLVTDIEDSLAIVGSQVERGGILLVDTDDPAIMAMVVEFIDEQRSSGKWFRAFFGAQPGQRTEDYITIAGSLDSSRARLVCQRVGVFTANETTIQFLDPIFLAAAMAGGAAGNQPFKNPLTNKRLRFAALHEDDNFDVVTREALLEGGVTVIKKEFDRLVVTLAVTTSRDPDRRMPRIMSEVDTVDQVDADMRFAFLPFRGKWANLNLAAAVFTVGNAVLNFFSDPHQGALVGGEDQQGNPVPPWSWQEPAFTLFAGVLTLDYQINIAGELDHVSEHGRAEYTRIVGQVPGGATSLSTVIPA